VTAFRKEKRRSDIGVMPRTSHITVGEMKKADVFHVVHGDDFSDFSTFDDFFDGQVIFGITEDMADNDVNAFLFC